MAFVTDGFNLAITMGGVDGSSQTRNYDLVAATYADAVTATATIIGALVAISDGNIKGYTIGSKFVEDAYTRPTVASAERGDAAIVTAEIDGNPLKKVNFSVPYPKQGLFLADLATGGENYNVVDIGDAGLLAYAAIWQTGGQALISDGEVLGAIVKGKRA